MIQLETEPFEVYNHREQLKYSYVMFMSLALECFRLQQPAMRFDRVIATNNKYKILSTDNRKTKKLKENLRKNEMEEYDKVTARHIKNNQFMCDSFSSTIPKELLHLEGLGTELLDKLFPTTV
jgi:hypothetical protein